MITRFRQSSAVGLDVRRVRALSNVGENHRTNRDPQTIRQHFTFDFDDAANPTHDSRVRLEELVRPRGARKFERTERGDAPHAAAVDLRTAAGRGNPTGLRQQFNQHNRGNHRIAWKVSLEKPVGWAGDAETTSRFSRHDIGHLLHEPHGWTMRKKIDNGPC